MSIYIHGMDMPTKENTVILISPYGDVWMIGDMPNEDTHLAKAKAISVSAHGRLIDADVLVKSDRMVGKLMMYGGEYVYTQSEIDRAPTIISADDPKLSATIKCGGAVTCTVTNEEVYRGK